MEFGCLIERWGAAWGLPNLPGSISVKVNPRLRRSLGRCNPASGRISLSADLLHAPERLEEVLCHEVAHVAVFQLFGSQARAHGPEWRQLLSSAGFQPEVRAKERTSPPRAHPKPLGLPYEHRCPVCQGVRYARRPVTSWRCSDCLDSGLGGELVITRHQPPRSNP
jgi:predicted SprT family Zn-dependent metalloprotease